MQHHANKNTNKHLCLRNAAAAPLHAMPRLHFKPLETNNSRSQCRTCAAVPSSNSILCSIASQKSYSTVAVPQVGQPQAINWRRQQGGKSSSSSCLSNSSICDSRRWALSSGNSQEYQAAFTSNTVTPVVVAFSQVQRFETTSAGKDSSSSSRNSSSNASDNTKQQSRSRLSRTRKPSDARQTRSSTGRKLNEQIRGRATAQQQQQQEEEPTPTLAWYEVPASTQSARGDSEPTHATGSHTNSSNSADTVDAADGSSSRAAEGVSDTTCSSSSSVSNFASQFPEYHQQQLHQYLDHMLEVNKQMNLTAIRDPNEAWQRHIEDSLALLPAIDKYLNSSSSPDSSSSSSMRVKSRSRAEAAADGNGDAYPQQQHQQQQLTVIDVGTGAGLPGMVFAIVRPHWKVTLLDSLRKRCDFLQTTADMLGLANVTVVWSRAEDGGNNPQHREEYNLAVARAVAELRVLSELCLPFVKPGGLWIAAKGANPEDEVAAADQALSKLGGELLAVERVDSWAPEGQRTAVVVKKCSRTPNKYPRPAGTPSKKPL